MQRGKVAIVGVGNVGTTIAYTLMMQGIFSEIALIDINRDKAEGEALDMNHGVSFVEPVQITAGDYSLCRDADLVIITAGANQKVGETRIDLLRRNAAIFQTIVENIAANAPHQPLLLVVTNPVDVLTYVTYKLSGYPKNKIIGSGTVLDTGRLKYVLSRYTGVDSRSIHTYVLGEHGDTEVAAWSVTSIAGLSIDGYCDGAKTCKGQELPQLFDRVRNAAYEIIEKKGATFYAVGLAVSRIVQAIVNDEKSVLTVSSVLEGEYGIENVCLSVPTVVGKDGIERILEAPISTEEQESLRHSAHTLSESLRAIGL